MVALNELGIYLLLWSAFVFVVLGLKHVVTLHHNRWIQKENARQVAKELDRLIQQHKQEKAPPEPQNSTPEVIE